MTARTGDVTVDAQNTSILDATTLASVTSAGDTVGVALAFNMMGWSAPDLIVSTLDTLLGDPAEEIFGLHPAQAKASIIDSTVTASVGAVSVTATNAARIEAFLSNAATAKSTAFRNASASSFGGAVAANKVSAAAEAVILSSDGTHTLDAGSTVTVRAEDNASIEAETALGTTSKKTNTAGMDLVNGLAHTLLDEYGYTQRSGLRWLSYGDKVRVEEGYFNTGAFSADHTTAAGSVSLVSGERVQLASDYENGGVSGATYAYVGSGETLELGSVDYSDIGLWRQMDGILYEFMGETTLVDLGSQDYSDYELWKALSTDNIIPKSLAGSLGKLVSSSGGAKATYALVAFNEVTSDALASIENLATVTAGGDVTVEALENATLTATERSKVSTTEGSGGVISLNMVNSDAKASIVSTDVTTAVGSDGDVVVGAQNTARIDASTTTRTEAGKDTKGLVVALNTVGYDSSNILFGVLESLLGTDAFSLEPPSSARAWVEASDISADGDVSVTARNASTLNATAGNEQIVTAVNEFVLPTLNKGKDNEKGFGKTATTGGGLVAFNKVSSVADAYIGPRSTDYFLGQLIAEGAAVIEELTRGMRVEADGGLYEYIGEARWEDVDLEFENFTDTALWRRLAATAEAFVGASTVNAGGTVTVDAQDTAGIKANSSILATAFAENNLKGVVDLLDSFILDDYKYTTASGLRTVFNLNPLDVISGELVSATVTPQQVVETAAGALYKFIGAVSETIDLTVENYDDAFRWEQVAVDLAGEVLTGSEIALQTRVRLGSDYAGPAGEDWGDAGAVYKYVGLLPQVLELGTQDYSNGLLWEKVTGGIDDLDDWYPEIGNLTDSNAKTTGITVVLNEVRSDVEAYIENADVDAASVTVTATADASIFSTATATANASGGSAFGGGEVVATNGQLVTNLVDGQAVAHIAHSTIDTTGAGGTTGDVTVAAKTQTTLDATLNSSTDSGEKAKSLSLALNTLGYTTHIPFLDTVKSLLSKVLGVEDPSPATAYIVDSAVNSAGAVSVTADNAARLNATVSNAASSEASALWKATGSAMGGAIALNRMASGARAYIEDRLDIDLQGTSVTAVDAVTVEADDKAELYSNVKIVTSSITTNDGGASALNETVADVLPADYSTGEGVRDVLFGERVRLADDYDATKGNAGSVYEFMGRSADGAGIDLGTTDYSDLGLWKEVLETQLIPQGNNITASDSSAMGGIVVLNDMRSEAEAFIEDVAVDAAAVTVRAIEDATMVADGGRDAWSPPAAACSARASPTPRAACWR